MPFSEPSMLGAPALVLADEPIPLLVEGQEGFPRPLPLLARQQVQQPLLGREAKQESEVAWRVQDTPTPPIFLLLQGRWCLADFPR